MDEAFEITMTSSIVNATAERRTWCSTSAKFVSKNADPKQLIDRSIL